MTRLHSTSVDSKKPGSCCTVTKPYSTLCDPMNCSTPGFPVFHYLLEPTQTHVHWVGDAIQLSCPMSSPSSLALNFSQHQGLFQWVSSSHQVAKVLELQLQLPMNIQDWFPLGLTNLISLQAKGLSKDFSSTTVWKHQFFGPQPSLWSSSHIHTWLLEKLSLWLDGPLSAKWWLCCLGFHCFSSKEQVSFNFVAADTICSDFGAQENKVSHCFHFSPIYLPWSDGTECHDLCFVNVEF